MIDPQDVEAITNQAQAMIAGAESQAEVIAYLLDYNNHLLTRLEYVMDEREQYALLAQEYKKKLEDTCK